MTTFEEAFDLTGYGKLNTLALFTNGLLLMYATTECLGLGFVLTKAICDLNVNTGQRAAISSATFLGVVTPAIFWGIMADTYGRRTVMLPATFMAVVCSILSSFSVNFISMFLLRFITGFMVSSSCATAYVYLGEMVSPSSRSEFIAWASAFIAGSYILMPISAWAVLPDRFSIHVAGRLRIVSWRVLMWLYTIWGTAACVGMYLLPESPSYVLLSRGAPEARAVLAKIYSWNNNKPADEYPVKELNALHSTHPGFKETLRHMKHMIRPPLLRCVVISHICNFMVFMQSNSFYVWMPHIVDEMLRLPKTNYGHNMCAIMHSVHKMANSTTRSHSYSALLRIPNIIQWREQITEEACMPLHVDHGVYPIATGLGFILVCVYMTIGAVSRRLGNQLVYNVIMIVCGVLILVAVVVPHPFWSIAFFIPGLCSIAANTVLAAVVVQVFPTSLRAQAVCTLFMVGRLGAAVGSELVGWGLGHSCMLIIVCIVCITMASGVLLYMWPDANKVRAEMEAKNFNY